MSSHQIQGCPRVKKLKKLILEVLKNQRELSRVLLDKNIGLLSPSLVQITDPRMLLEERKLIEDIENRKNLTSADYQETLKDLEIRCDLKNKIITNLLRSLQNCETLDSQPKKNNKKNNKTKNNPPVVSCPDCKKKIKPRKICKKCGEIEISNSKHFLKCSDCGNEIVQKKICQKCRELKFESCASSVRSASDYQSAESLTTVTVPVPEVFPSPETSKTVTSVPVSEIFSSPETSKPELELEFIRKPSESFKSADGVSSTSLFREERPPETPESCKIRESFLSIKMQEDKNFEEDEESIDRLEMSFVKLSNELQEILPNVFGRVEDSGDHPSINYYTPVSKPATPLTPPPTQENLVVEDNNAFDVEVYDADDIEENEDENNFDSVNNTQLEEVKADEKIKTVTEYDAVSQKIIVDTDSEYYFELEEPRALTSETEEEFEEFDETDIYVPGLQMVFIPSSMSFQTAMRLFVALDEPKNSCLLTPLHSFGKIQTGKKIQTASSANSFTDVLRTRACILITVKQSFTVPFLILSELPQKQLHRKASLAVAKTEPTQKLPTVMFVHTTPDTKIEIKDPEMNRVEIKKIVSPTETAIFQTQKNLIFAGIQLKEKWPRFFINSETEAEAEENYQDANDLQIEKLLKALPGLPTVERESEDGIFASATDFLPESEEVFEKLLKLLSNLENAIKESKLESKSSEWVKEIGENVEILEKKSDLSEVAKLLEGDEVDACEEMKGEFSEMRESVLGVLKSEASVSEIRIEKNFDRIERLIRENDEGIKFVESFLEKTMRRAAEYQEIKTLAQELHNQQEFILEGLQKSINFSDKINLKDDLNETQSTTFEVVNDAIQSTTVKDTISVLIDDLDKLKNKAREKNERCKEIFGERFVLPEQAKPLTGLEKARSSFTMKREWTSILEFKNVRFNSFYLAWTKPEGNSAESIIGYEILVNGKINQKVRNPDRLQTVLYSVNPNEKTEIKLFGLTKQGSMLLGELTYLK